MTDAPTRALILAAGRGVRRLDAEESTPSPLAETPQGRAIMDRQVEALREVGVSDIDYLGGYHIEKLVDAHADIDYYYDPEWQQDGDMGGLARNPELLDGPSIVATGETMFDREAIERLLDSPGDVAVGVTTFASREGAREARRTLDDDRLVRIRGDTIEPVEDSEELPDARLLEIARVSSAGARAFVDALTQHRDERSSVSFGQVMRSLKEGGGVGVRAVDLDGMATHYNETHDLTSFILGTKAETLERLDGLLDEARTLDQIAFEVGSWEREPESHVERIQSAYAPRAVVVRSSALAEDGWRDSRAGAYHSELDVDSTDADELADAIEKVVRSLQASSEGDESDQVFVQPQLEDVALSGVAFTRELDSGGPYTVFNYDDASGRTDTVTGGAGVEQRTVYIHHGVEDLDGNDIDQEIVAVKRAVDELRDLLGDPPLDVELAVDDDGTVVVLQVRPLAVHTGEDRYDLRDVENEIESVESTVDRLQQRRPLLDGDGTALGVMPDWNPAEMIGTDPDPLAISLYEHLITDNIWARARAESGYRDVRPEPLMVALAGKPYIDTLTDFNSFLPASLPPELGRRLVNQYVGRLADNPDLQDKVEFEVAVTCFDFNFEERASELSNAGFADGEIETLREHLLELTDPMVKGEVASIESQRTRLERLGPRRRRLLEADPSDWPETVRTVRRLLADAREFGTLPFSILARYAFVATSMLESLHGRGVLSRPELDRIQEGMPTIATDVSRDMARLRDGDVDPESFLQRYGHLRPGTYDICSRRYDEAPDVYFDIDGTTVDPIDLDRRRDSAIADWSPEMSADARAVFEDARGDISEAIRAEGFSFTVDELVGFITRSIPLRELAKFEFTQNLSTALTLLRRSGETHLGLAPEELAMLRLQDVFEPVTQNPSPVLVREYERSINHATKRSAIQARVHLPPFIGDSGDVRVFEVVSERPNYITDDRTTGRVVRIDDPESVTDDLDGTVVLIPAADPGYDWIFGSDIAGLVTKYGGVASHMAIRAAEFGLPAAIGCGEVVYQNVSQAEVLELDCREGHLREVR